MRTDTEAAGVAIEIVLVTGVLHDFLAGGHGGENPVEDPRLRVEFGIFDPDGVIEVIGIEPLPALDHVHLIAVRMSIVIDPAQAIFEADGIDDQRVAVPASNSVAEVRSVDAL